MAKYVMRGCSPTHSMVWHFDTEPVALAAYDQTKRANFFRYIVLAVWDDKWKITNEYFNQMEQQP